MQCDDARRMMTKRLDNARDDPRLEAHLRSCGRCRAEWKALAATDALLRSVSLVDPPPGLASRIVAGLDGLPSLANQRPAPVLQIAFVLCGAATILAGFASVYNLSTIFALDEGWLVLANSVARWLRLVGHTVGGPSGALLAQWLACALAAAAITVGWFGALVVPRGGRPAEGTRGLTVARDTGRSGR